MSTEQVKVLTSLRRDGRILLALQKLLPHLKRFVLRSRFIDTKIKDGIVTDLDTLSTTLKDAYHRSVGQVPYTKKQMKRQKELVCQMFPESPTCKQKPTV